MQPENIVLVDNECSEIKLVDFGAAKDLNEEEKGAAFALVGTPEFVGMYAYRYYVHYAVHVFIHMCIQSNSVSKYLG